MPQLPFAELAPNAELGYQDPFDHLLDELVWVRVLLQRLVLAKRARGELQTGGISVPDNEVTRFLVPESAAVPGEGEASAPVAPEEAARRAQLLAAEEEQARLRELARGLRARIRQREERSEAKSGPRLPLVALRRRFGLSEEELDVLRVLMAPELDPRFERAFSYAWNDFTRKRASLGFVLELLADDLRSMESYRDLLAASAPLRRSELVLVPPAQDIEQVGFLGRPVLLSPRVVDFLRGRDEPDESVRRYGCTPELREALDQLVLPEAIKRQAAAVAAQSSAGGSEGQRALLLWGRARSGKRSLVRAAARAAGRSVWSIDLGALFADPERLQVRLAALLREARMADAVALVDASEDVPAEGVSWGQAAVVADALRECPGPVFVCSPHRLPWLSQAWSDLRELALPLPDASERVAVLTRSLEGLGPLDPDLDLGDVASRYGLPAGALVRAAQVSRELADEQSLGSPVRRADLMEAGRRELSHRLSSLAQQIHSVFGWDDVVLPDSTDGRLMELLAFARNRRFVMEEWGFRHLLPYGSGLTALFTGPPGTGKTMVAGILARELGMELFRVDLSRIVDKYVGETEKNLARVFDEAEKSQAILLFDEADSLFARRTDVRSSVDRYANLEVNFLLQRMENFDGMSILTTNLDQNLDDAFKRRIKFHIPFPFPDERSRVLLWERMLPDEAECEDDVDMDELGEYELAGGHIKNAILRAAVRAADEKRGISMEDLHYAATQETMGMGRLIRDDG